MIRNIEKAGQITQARRTGSTAPSCAAPARAAALTAGTPAPEGPRRAPRAAAAGPWAPTGLTRPRRGGASPSRSGAHGQAPGPLQGAAVA